MEEFTALCNDATAFPKNFKQRSSPSHNLGLYEYLDSHATRLFSVEAESALDFLELSSRGKGTGPSLLSGLASTTLTCNSDFWPKCIRTEARLRTHLGLTTTSKSVDPRCRYL